MNLILRMLPIVLALAACSTQRPSAQAGVPPIEGTRAMAYITLRADRSEELDDLTVSVRRRIDAAGYENVAIEKSGADVRVEAPASVDIDRLINLLTKRGVLTMNLVDMSADPNHYVPREEREGRVAVPDDSDGGRLLVVFVDPIVRSFDIADATNGYDNFGKPNISFELHAGGAQRFSRTTLQNVGRRFAIIIDDRAISVPDIRSPITTGKGQITGEFTGEEAEQLAAVLRSGSLPKFTVVERGVVE